MFVQAVTGALAAARCPSLKNLAVVKIFEYACRRCQCRSARVIEQEKTFQKMLKIGLISDQKDFGITQESFPAGPTESAGGTGFKNTVLSFGGFFGTHIAMVLWIKNLVISRTPSPNPVSSGKTDILLMEPS
jgi:hypothetical protein